MEKLKILLFRKMINKVFFAVVLVHLAVQIECEVLSEGEDLFLTRFAQFHCYKLKICTPGGGKVCGHDERAALLAYFRDVCELHKANCRRAGIYTLVDLTVCDMKFNYTITFKDEFQFEPILRNTVAPSTVNEGDPEIGDPNIGSSSNGQESSTKSLSDETFVRVQPGSKDKKGYGLVRLLNGDKGMYAN